MTHLQRSYKDYSDTDIVIEKLLSRYVCYLGKYLDDYPTTGKSAMYGKTPAIVKASIKSACKKCNIDISNYNIVVKGE